MLTLTIFLLTLAVMSAGIAASLTREPEPALALPPLALGLPVALLGLRWRLLGERNTAGGPRLLWLADGDASAYSRLYNADRDGMRSVGFGWGGLIRGDVSSPVCWERLPEPADLVYVEAISNAAGKAAEAEELKARREAERTEEERRLQERLAIAAAEKDSREMPVRLEAVAELQERVRELPWAWTRGQRDRITDIMARADAPTAADYGAIRGLIYTLEEMLDRVGYRLSTVRLAEWWDRAADPEVRAAALKACRLLSSLDADHASIDNNIGWSKAHTHAGHLLASKAFLDQTEASHALKAVWVHRRQIRPELQAAIFGTEA